MTVELAAMRERVVALRNALRDVSRRVEADGPGEGGAIAELRW